MENINQRCMRIAAEFADKVIREDIINFLVHNPNPNDDVIYSWSEHNGYEHDDVENEIYKLATKFVNFIKGGRANKKGVSVYDVDPDQLRAGIEVEYEHSPDPDVAMRIALDHLAELKDYYTRLHKMEAEGLAELGISE